MKSKTTIELEHSFEAAHHLPDSAGLTTKKCLNLHGHTYGVRIVAEAERLTDDFVVDFGSLKSLIDDLDHATILWDKDTELMAYLDNNGFKKAVIPYPPTAENIAHFIYDMLNENLPLTTYVSRVEVLEGTKPGKVSWVIYEELED